MADSKKAEKTEKTTGKTVKIKFLKSPAGKFLLSYRVGQVVEMEEKQASEIIEAGYAEKV